MVIGGAHGDLVEVGLIERDLAPTLLRTFVLVEASDRDAEFGEACTGKTTPAYRVPIIATRMDVPLVSRQLRVLRNLGAKWHVIDSSTARSRKGRAAPCTENLKPMRSSTRHDGGAALATLG